MAAGEITVQQFFSLWNGTSYMLEINVPALPVSAEITHTPVTVLIHSVELFSECQNWGKKLGFLLQVEEIINWWELFLKLFL